MASVSKKGFIYKADRAQKHWQNRYFRLEGPLLKSFKDDNIKTSVKTAFNLADSDRTALFAGEVVVDAKKAAPPTPHVLVLKMSERTLQLAFQTEESRTEWVDAMRKGLGMPSLEAEEEKRRDDEEAKLAESHSAEAEEEARRDHAAVRIQSVHRQKAAKAHVNQRRQEIAATKIQAAHRGKEGRKRVERIKSGEEALPASTAKAPTETAAAATTDVVVPAPGVEEPEKPTAGAAEEEEAKVIVADESLVEISLDEPAEPAKPAAEKSKKKASKNKTEEAAPAGPAMESAKPSAGVEPSKPQADEAGCCCVIM